eukprot:TRINITY_DN34241_c2_g1_i1.p1 TRINITY_DN34241_c2_g1~~TRINITY_DN34241_c2_g1_i1.p1  ORF type:complete len:342 (-),score=69.32 TRINITY_DN34241_c2_g1_i1:32-982(-)
MGFGRERSVRALHFSGNNSLEGALNWLEEHGEDAGIDEILLVKKEHAVPKKQLTPEEAKAKAAELQAKAKAKREAAERANEKESEKLRIQMGRELSAAQRAEEDQKLERIAKARQLEKQEFEAARAKIRAKLEQDRKERRKKLGLPEELTPEEQEAENKRLAEQAEQDARHKLTVKPVTRISNMREILVQMKKQAAQDKFMTCCKTLTAYCKNVYMYVDDDSKRKIKRENKALQERVAPMPGGLQFLHEVGFEEEGEFYVMPKKDPKLEKATLEGAAEVLDSAMTNPMFGMLQAVLDASLENVLSQHLFHIIALVQ